MTTLDELTGDPGKTFVILHAVRAIIANEGQPTPENVSPYCEAAGFGEATQEECDAGVSFINQGEAAAPVEPQAVEPTPEPPKKLSAVDREQLLERLRLTNILIADARANVITLTNLRNRAREKMANAITAWTIGLPKMTHVEAMREVVKTGQMVRAQGGSPARSKPGPSAYDRERFYSGPAYGDARDYVRKLQRRGGNRRGAYPLSMARGPVDTGGASGMALPRTNSGNNREA